MVIFVLNNARIEVLLVQVLRFANNTSFLEEEMQYLICLVKSEAG